MSISVKVSTKKRKSSSDDEIQVLEKDIETKPATSRRRTSKPKKCIDSDSEDNGELINLKTEISLPETRPRVYKTFFMLNSAECKI